MYGHDSLPSRIYAYKALRPTSGLDLVFDQLRHAHRYRNDLIALERTRHEMAHHVLVVIHDVEDGGAAERADVMRLSAGGWIERGAIEHHAILASIRRGGAGHDRGLERGQQGIEIVETFRHES